MLLLYLSEEAIEMLHGSRMAKRGMGSRKEAWPESRCPPSPISASPGAGRWENAGDMEFFQGSESAAALGKGLTSTGKRWHREE